MPSKPAQWSLTIPSDLRLLALARSFVEAVCLVAGMNDRDTHSVVLSADEAVNNVMRHAHRDRPEAELQIQCFVTLDALEILIHDEGAPFNIETVPNFNPAELRVGGRGVFLMRRLMDELGCAPRSQRGNTLRMVKRFQPAPAVSGAG